jgi:hypothetical protein
VSILQADAIVLSSDEDPSKPGTPGTLLQPTKLTLALPSEESISPPALEKPSPVRADPSDETMRLLIEFVFPKLGQILDQDRTLAACTLIVNQIIGPAVRKRNLYT